MYKVNMKRLWSNEEEKIINEVNKATKNIESVINHGFDERVFECIREVCNYWCSNTYVGYQKKKTIETAFQNFYVKLMELFISIKDKKITVTEEVYNYSRSLLYRGIVYRYLGHGNSEECKSIIEPDYNHIYVSWSKNETDSYLESKLYGTMTHLTCEIREPYYGIDLEVLGTSRIGEREVLFPTIEDTIINKKYIK